MNEIDTAIVALEDYLRRYPDGSFSEIAQLRLDQLLAKRGEERIAIVSDVRNPFSKGTVAARTDYRVGDSYEYRVTDLHTRITRIAVDVVTAVSEIEVIYNEGRLVTDPLGNSHSRGGGVGVNNRYPAEYAVGRKWSARFRSGNSTAFVEYKYAVVGRESITVPAGTFDAFKVEGTGFNTNGTRLEVAYWIAPQRVRRRVLLETWAHASTSLRATRVSSERIELVRFSENAT